MTPSSQPLSLDASHSSCVAVGNGGKIQNVGIYFSDGFASAVRILLLASASSMEYLLYSADPCQVHHKD